MIKSSKLNLMAMVGTVIDSMDAAPGINLMNVACPSMLETKTSSTMPVAMGIGTSATAAGSLDDLMTAASGTHSMMMTATDSTMATGSSNHLVVTNSMTNILMAATGSSNNSGSEINSMAAAG